MFAHMETNNDSNFPGNRPFNENQNNQTQPGGNQIIYNNDPPLPSQSSVENNLNNNIVTQVSQNISSSFLDKISFNVSFLQSYFDVETDEIIQRLLASLIPFNKNFISLVEKKPDLYGPFWIYTTLVFIVAVAGSLTKYIQGAKVDNYFQEFVPLASSVIYGIGFCLPLIIKVLMYIFGSETSFMLVLCIYAYSFSIYGPIFILCIPVEKLQWFLLFYAVLSSTVFLLINFWTELSKYVDNRKYFILGVIGIFQISLFFVLKFKFFAKLKLYQKY